jgi:spore photoproduct lyase
MDCAYCVLQGYFHPPLLQLFVNHEALDRELDRAFGDKAFRRIGTGEFTDSLIWEPWTDLVPGLIMRFGKQNHMILELKTKTVMVDRLKGLHHRRRTVVSWSMNTPEMIRQNERATATLESRLKAAGKCQSWGYPLAFHFDPVILYEGAEDDYNRVIDRLFSVVSPENIAWISIGSFRFSAELKPIIEKRFPSSKIVYGELITGMDDKFRYFKPLRIKLYAKMVSRIRRYAPSTTVYFCMEDDRTWRQVMGFVPSDIGGLGALLDNSVTDVCGLNSA